MPKPPDWYVAPAPPSTGALLLQKDRHIMTSHLHLLPRFFHQQPHDHYAKPWNDPSYSESAFQYVSAPSPGDQSDKTTTIQQAIDQLWDHFQATGDPCFLYLQPGTYFVDTLYPFYGLTIHGYGATLKRHGYDWYIADSNNDPDIAAQRMRWAKTLNGHQYHPRIHYKWRGPGKSAPLRLVGLTLDGNRQESAPYENYQLEHAHLITLSTDPSPDASDPNGGDGQVTAEIIDVTTRDGVADGIAIITNVECHIERYVSLDCFRGGITQLGSNNIVTGKNWYISGNKFSRALDSEPVGTSAGFDYHDNVPLSPDQRSARSYWDVCDAVLGGGFDWATVVLAPDSNTYHGGSYTFSNTHVLRTHMLNLISYGHNPNGCPTVSIKDSYLHIGSIYPHASYSDPEDLRRWWHSSIRWPGFVHCQNSTFILDAPPHHVLASIFQPAQGNPPSKAYLTGITIDMTTLAAPFPEAQRWPNRQLVFHDCSFTIADLDKVDPAFRSKLVIMGLKINGDAASDHTVELIGGSFDPGFDHPVYLNGGRLIVTNTALGNTTYISALSRDPYGWTYDVAAHGVGSATYTLAPTATGSITWEP